MIIAPTPSGDTHLPSNLYVLTTYDLLTLEPIATEPTAVIVVLLSVPGGLKSLANRERKNRIRYCSLHQEMFEFIPLILSSSSKALS